MRVALGPEVDVALRPAERPEVLAHVLRVGLAVIIAAIMKVVSMILRKPSCSAK